MATRRRRGWAPVPKGKPIALLEPIHIKRWGYEVDRQTVLDKLMAEACADDNGNRKTFIEDQNPHLTIAQRHPLFRKYWELMPGAFNLALHELQESYEGRKIDFQIESKLVYDVHWKVVEHYVQQIVRAQMGREQERKLWTDGFSSNSVASGSWRGPWDVLYKRVVKTGRYYPATGGDEDCDPAMLCDEKTHVLFWVERARLPGMKFVRDADNLGGQFIVERSNTVEWSNQRSAEILMETP
jgi:hypothetical protein